MPTSARSGSAGENIHHLSHIRLRVVGNGTLRHTVYSLDDVKSKELPTLAMNSVTDRIPTKLTNFVTQRAALKGYTTAINEYFKINRIVLFFKEYGSEYPM